MTHIERAIQEIDSLINEIEERGINQLSCVSYPLLDEAHGMRKEKYIFIKILCPEKLDSNPEGHEGV